MSLDELYTIQAALFKLLFIKLCFDEELQLDCLSQPTIELRESNSYLDNAVTYLTSDLIKLLPSPYLIYEQGDLIFNNSLNENEEEILKLLEDIKKNNIVKYASYDVTIAIILNPDFNLPVDSLGVNSIFHSKNKKYIGFSCCADDDPFEFFSDPESFGFYNFIMDFSKLYKAYL